MSAAEPDRAANPFWDYSLRLYDRAAEACLALQDRQDLDVNLLLFCCWQASRGVTLDSVALRELQNATADWRNHVVAPLRSLRRGLKARGQAEVAALRRLIKDSELEAERLQQARLYELAGPAAGPADAAAAAANLGVYCRSLGVDPVERDRADLAAILAAAVSDWSPEQARAALAAALA